MNIFFLSLFWIFINVSSGSWRISLHWRNLSEILHYSTIHIRDYTTIEMLDIQQHDCVLYIHSARFQISWWWTEIQCDSSMPGACWMLQKKGDALDTISGEKLLLWWQFCYWSAIHLNPLWKASSSSCLKSESRLARKAKQWTHEISKIISHIWKIITMPC